MPKTFQFPVWLKGTKAQQQAESERQSLALAAHTRAHLTEAERLIGRGELLEKTAQANLDLAKTDEQRTLAESQLADAMAMQGQFADAAATHPDPIRQEHFQEIITALEMSDAERCDCPDSKVKVGDTPLSVTPRFERERIYSPIHGDSVSLVECSVCHHMNARPLRSRLLKINAAQSASGQLGQASSNDVQIFRTDETAK